MKEVHKPIVGREVIRLRQVLINLLGNALKSTEISVITFKVSYQAEKTRFQVEDTAIGIAPKQLEEIFLPFQQLGNKIRETEGTGLGLTISCQLVQLMSGVKVKNILRLPRKPHCCSI